MTEELAWFQHASFSCQTGSHTSLSRSGKIHASVNQNTDIFLGDFLIVHADVHGWGDKNGTIGSQGCDRASHHDPAGNLDENQPPRRSSNNGMTRLVDVW